MATLTHSVAPTTRRIRRHRPLPVQLSALDTLLARLEDHHPATVSHSRRVGEYAFRLTSLLGWKPEVCARIRLAGQLHDIGKLRLPHDVLTAARPLTLSERHAFNQHPTEGACMVADLTTDDIVKGVLQHHERYDGKINGVQYAAYPLGHAGLMIHPFARILAVCDSFDAMTVSRAYRPAFSPIDAIRRLIKESGKMYQPRLVNAFKEAFASGAMPLLAE